MTETPPLFAPEFFDFMTGGQDSPADAACGFALGLDSTARLDTGWIVESAGDRPVRLTPLEWSSDRASVGFESLGVSGVIGLAPHRSGWVRAEVAIDGRVVLTAFVEQIWEEYELYPAGFPARAASGDEPGRIGKRRTWLVLSAAAWPVLAPLANEAGWVQAVAVDR